MQNQILKEWEKDILSKYNKKIAELIQNTDIILKKGMEISKGRRSEVFEDAVFRKKAYELVNFLVENEPLFEWHNNRDLVYDFFKKVYSNKEILSQRKLYITEPETERRVDRLEHFIFDFVPVIEDPKTLGPFIWWRFFKPFAYRKFQPSVWYDIYPWDHMEPLDYLEIMREEESGKRQFPKATPPTGPTKKGQAPSPEAEEIRLLPEGTSPEDKPPEAPPKEKELPKEPPKEYIERFLIKLSPPDRKTLFLLENDRKGAVESGDINQLKYLDYEIEKLISKYVEKIPFPSIEPLTMIPRVFQSHLGPKRVLNYLIEKSAPALQEIGDNLNFIINQASVLDVETDEWDEYPENGTIYWVLSIEPPEAISSRSCIFKVSVKGDKIDVIPEICDSLGRRFPLDEAGIDFLFSDVKRLEKF